MERRAASHTEEEEMNQRRRLLSLARKGDLKAINRLFELYQVRVYSGDVLSKGKKPTAVGPAHKNAKSVPKRPSAKAPGTSRRTARKLTQKTRHR
jgi:hypothetical protein